MFARPEPNFYYFWVDRVSGPQKKKAILWTSFFGISKLANKLRESEFLTHAWNLQSKEVLYEFSNT